MALNGFVVKHQFFLTSWYYPNEESNLRPLDSAPRCSNHWVTADFTVSEVYHEVHMTRVLHTVRISNVDSVMFVNRIREILSFDHRSAESESLRFDSSWVLNIFSLSHARDKTYHSNRSVKLKCWRLLLKTDGDGHSHFCSLNANQQIKILSKIFQDLYHFNCFMRGATKLYFELRYWNLKLETCPWGFHVTMVILNIKD